MSYQHGHRRLGVEVAKIGRNSGIEPNGKIIVLNPSAFSSYHCMDENKQQQKENCEQINEYHGPNL
jgi:hypothetical protein